MFFVSTQVLNFYIQQHVIYTTTLQTMTIDVTITFVCDRFTELSVEIDWVEFDLQSTHYRLRCPCARHGVGCLWLLLPRPNTDDHWYEIHRHARCKQGWQENANWPSLLELTIQAFFHTFSIGKMLVTKMAIRFNLQETGEARNDMFALCHSCFPTQTWIVLAAASDMSGEVDGIDRVVVLHWK